MSEGGNGEKKVYGDYEVVKPIGKGKFAVVYRACRISDNETVALKRISVDSIDDKARDKCLKEVKLLQSLDHPNVIKYLDSFITDNDLVIVVEWAAAGDLKRQLRKAQERGVGFEERIIWKYFSQMCDAMLHLREKRIMHRDLKPANIFLTLDGTVKVGDLGLSRELSEHTVQAHSKVGTPLYMSPEVLRGDGYDFQSDIWSLGCMLYELAMLKSPFKSEGLNLYSLFQKISQGDFQPLPENYSEDLRSLTYAMISTDAKDRPEIADVCKIASKMRQLTAEQHASSKKSKTEENGPQQDSKSERSIPGTSINNSTLNSNNSTMKTDGSNNRDEGNMKQITEEFQRWKKDDAKADDESKTIDDNRDRDRRQETMKGDDYDRNKKDPKKTMKGDDYLGKVNLDDYIDEPKKQDKATKETVVPYSRPRLKNDEDTRTSSSARAAIKQQDDVLSPAFERRDTRDDDNKIFANSSVALALMDVLYGRLIALGYPLEDPLVGRSHGGKGQLLPIHFACDMTMFGHIAGYDKSSGANPYFQYRRMVHVALWLFNKFDDSARINIDIDNSTPLTVAKQLIVAAQNFGVSSGDLNDITPTSLAVGYGEKVCIFLLFLTDLLITSGKFKAPSLKYIETNDINDDNEMNQNDDAGEEEEEILDTSIEIQQDVNETLDQLEPSIDDGHVAASIVVATIDPVLWREETERVSSKLIVSNYRTGDGSWGDHLNMIKDHGIKFNKFSVSERDKDDVNVLSQLQTLSKDIHNTLSDIRRTEGILHATRKNSEMSEEFSRYKQALESLSARSAAATSKIEALTNQQAEIEEKLEELNDKFQDKSNGLSGGEDSSSIVGINKGIKTVKEDINEMSIRIGVLSHVLLAKKVQAMTASRKKGRPKSKQKYGKVTLDNSLDESI